MTSSNFKIVIFFSTALIAIGALVVFFYLYKWGDKTITIGRDNIIENPADDIVGSLGYGSQSIDSCPNFKRRPFAVMIAEDSEARPLSGIGMADIVIEMPVVTGSITRMMAIFICEDPQDIGSVRSARHDFIPLAQGFNAIFAHWGGSEFALDELSKGVIDNLDALPNYFDTFYRKKGTPAPHNGFTSMESMINAAEKLGYKLDASFDGYTFLEAVENPSGYDGADMVEVNYKYPYNVRYEYDVETGFYLRWRGGLREIDALTDEQIKVRNIAVMFADSRQIGGGYNDVDVLGSGDAIIYRNGEETSSVWRKEKTADVLRFYDKSGFEINFVPGNIWIEIIEP